MRILNINTYDIEGGAARAAYRLHRSLSDQNIESEMLVYRKKSGDPTVTMFVSDSGRVKKHLRNFQYKFLNPVKKYPDKTKTYFSASFLNFSNIVKTINAINPDVVHLHWICDEMIKIEDLSRIKVPIVWSLHDMWAFTGGCHYDEECGRYTDRCGQCKVLRSDSNNDLSSKIFRRKQKTFQKIKNMTIVGLSRWLSRCAKKSALLQGEKIITLPNSIDSQKFKPTNKKNVREMLSLPSDKKLVLFGAMGATNDPRKGFAELQEAINKIEDKNIELIIFGNSLSAKEPTLKFKTHYLGQFRDEISLSILYNACDVMIVPSLQENLSNVIMESLSCGLPVVGFYIGGNSDLIDHKNNGYLAQPFDTTDLAKGIEWVLNAKNYDELCKNAREKVLRRFDSEVVARKYIELYKKVLQKQGRRFSPNE